MSIRLSSPYHKTANGWCPHHTCSEEKFMLKSIPQIHQFATHEVRWPGRMRGAIMPSLIFFVTFFYQGKKVREQDNKQ